MIQRPIGLNHGPWCDDPGEWDSICDECRAQIADPDERWSDQ